MPFAQDDFRKGFKDFVNSDSPATAVSVLGEFGLIIRPCQGDSLSEFNFSAIDTARVFQSSCSRPAIVLSIAPKFLHSSGFYLSGQIDVFHQFLNYSV